MPHTPSLVERSARQADKQHAAMGAPTGKTDDRFASTLTLALWRLRQTWGLLFMASIGFVAAMIIACVVPLFSTVATSGSLQSIFQGAPGRNDLTLSVSAQGLSTHVVSTLQHQFKTSVQDVLGPYQQASVPLSIQEGDLKVLAPASLQQIAPLSLYTTDLTSLEPHLHLSAGRWPAETTPGVLEVLLTPQAAQQFHLSLGAELTLQGQFATVNSTSGPIYPGTQLAMRLVGLFQVPQSALPLLHGQSFLPAANATGASTFLLASTPALLTTLDEIAARAHADAVFSYLSFQLTWDYPLHTNTVQPEQVDDLINRLATAQANVSNYQSGAQQLTFGMTTFPYVTQANLYNPVPHSYALLDLLEQYSSRVALVSIPLSILAVQIIALLLFFVGLLMSMLVDRQLATNALLSSRGASGRQLFWSLSLQGWGICLLGVLLGPLVGTAIVSTLAQQVVSGGGEHILHAIVAQPGLWLLQIVLPTGGTLFAALLTMSLLIRSATRLNTLTLRQETSRATRAPFWLRAYLDVLAALVALSAYGVSLYLASVAHEVDVNTQDLLLAPLTLVAPIFLLLGCLLLFLRAFPWFLRLGSWTASQGRGSASMLALVQMARAPRQVTRMILLLSLTVAFAMFALAFNASQVQRTSDVATYESGADFSGDLSDTLNKQPLASVLAQYRAIPGVLSASADYTDQGSAPSNDGQTTNITLRAIDSQSFAPTAIWTTTDSSQSLTSLLTALTNAQATTPNVPTVIDQALANQLGLHVGNSFNVSLNELGQVTLIYQVVAIVNHLPTVNASATASTAISPGGMLVDYHIFDLNYRTNEAAQVNQGDPLAQVLPSNFPAVPVNHLWLRTASDAQALVSVRKVLTTSQLQVTNLYDRRAITSDLQHDPFYLNMLLILGIGAITAFLLALIGNLLASWVNVRTRQSNFVVLRALGATSRQIAATLLWEQGIVYVSALGLGLAFGTVLIKVAVPVLVFTDLPAHGPMSALSTTDLYLLQQALPAQLVVPLALPLIFVALVLICAIALAIMIRAALHPKISSELRLNED